MLRISVQDVMVCVSVWTHALQMAEPTITRILDSINLYFTTGIIVTNEIHENPHVLVY